MKLNGSNEVRSFFPSISGIYDERLKTLNTLTISSWLKALERIWRDELTEKRSAVCPPMMPSYHF